MTILAMALAGAATAASLVAARPALPTPARRAMSTRAFDSALQAVEAAMAGADGGVVAFGELHQTEDTVRIPSALRRFTADILPALSPRLSDLVVETWMTTGRCGEAERVATADIQKTTERPASTESEIETLLRRAHERGVRPRILSVSCADYAAMRGGGDGVDYDRALRVTARALETAIVRAVGESAAAATSPGPRKLVAVYGGALHNDLVPEPALAPYSFVPRVLAATLGRYLELDLVVPEYAAASAAVRAQPWWRAYRRARQPGAAVLVERGPRSYVVVFPAQSGGHAGAGGTRGTSRTAPEVHPR